MISRKKLGKTQLLFLQALGRHGRYYRGCGWVWGKPSESVRLAESLLRLGYLRKVEEPSRGYVYYETEEYLALVRAKF